jgi:hypothetical protein
VNRKGAVALLLLALAAAAPSAAQEPAGAPVTVTVAPVTLSPGGRVEAKVSLEIARGIRLVAPGSPGQYLQPVLLAFDAADGVFVEPPAWPAGKTWHAEEGDPDLKVFEGRVDLKVVVHAGPKVAAQQLSLPGRLRYQAIDGPTFRKAAMLTLRMPVDVTAPPVPAKPAGPPAATRP